MKSVRLAASVRTDGAESCCHCIREARRNTRKTRAGASGTLAGDGGKFSDNEAGEIALNVSTLVSVLHYINDAD